MGSALIYLLLRLDLQLYEIHIRARTTAVDLVFTDRVIRVMSVV